MDIALSAIGVLRALIEVAGAFLIGQGALHVLAGASRERNPVYRLFRLLTSPVFSLMRRAAPKLPERNAGPAAFIVLLVVWVALAWIRLWLCVGACR